MVSPAPSSMYKRFLGSTFLSDFTLNITIEGQLRSAQEGNHDSQPGQASGPCSMSTQEAFSTPSSSPHATAQSDEFVGFLVTSDRPAHAAACMPTSRSLSCSAINQQQLAASTRRASAHPDACAVAATLPVHGVVLAAASPYFETLLRDWTGSSNRTIDMCVAEEQLVAGRGLISFIYQGTLPVGLSQHDLFQLLLLSDRFDVAACFDASARALGALNASELEWSTLLALTSLPDHLYESDQLAAARAVAAERQQQLFGDLEAAWAAADGRSKWRQLPFRAVAQLAASDALSCSENTLFAALTSWVAAAGATAGAEELKILAASVRLPYLSPCYLSYVVMQHTWFVSAISPLLLARAAAFAAASTDVKKDLLQATASLGCHAAAAAAAAAAPIDLQHQHSSHCGLGSTTSSCAVCGSSCSSGGATHGCSSTVNAIVQPAVNSMYKSALTGLSAAQMRCRLGSNSRSCSFHYVVELSRVKQLLEQVSVAGSRENRTIRSPAHFFGGYEFALQLEVTQTKGATGFDAGKPWALGVFLTCQVRSELPAGPAVAAAAGAGGGGGGTGGAGGAGGGTAAGLPGGSGRGSPQLGPATSGAGDCSSSSSSSSGSGTEGCSRQQLVAEPAAPQNAAAAASSSLLPLDYGFVSTATTISAREVTGGRDKRWERSWEHAMVRHRASWGWPNYLDISISGWDEAAFERWNIGGALHLTCGIKLLG